MSSALSKNASQKLDNLINLFGTMLCILLWIYGIRAGINEFMNETMPDKDLRVANWIIVSFFSFSFLMLTIEFLFRFRKKRVLKISEDKTASEAGF